MSKQLPIADQVPISRITPPPVIPHFVFRQELLARIDHSAPHATFIVAPSGYGKTSLAAQMVQNSERPVIWYTIERGDTPRETAVNMTAAGRVAIPNFAPWAEEFLATDFDVIEWTIRLCNEIGKIKGEVNVVFDGAEKFSDEHLGMTQTFVNNAPKNLCFISLRSVMPSVSYARPASIDALSFLGASDLKFTDSEIESIAKHHGVDYSNPEICAAFASVQGWPAGVQLVGKELARNGASAAQEIAKAIGADSRNILLYAIENLPCEDRDFLSKLVFLDRISELDAVRLVQREDATSQLQRLSDEGIFISRIAGATPSYQLNQLIRTVLSEKLKTDRPEWIATAKLSAEIADESGESLAAMEIYSSIGEDEKAKDIAVNNLQIMMTTANADLMRKWAPRIAESFGVPKLATKVLNVYGELSAGNFDVAQVLISEIEVDPELQQYAKDHYRELQLAKGRIAFSRGHFEDVISLLTDLPEQGVFDSLGLVSRKISGIRLALVSTFMMADYPRFKSFLEKALPLAEPDDYYVQSLTLPSIRAMDAYLDGRYREAMDHAQLALHTMESQKVAGIFIPYESAYVLADVYLEFGEEEKSLAVVDKYLPLAISAQQWPWVVGLLAKASLVRVQQGRINEALNLIRQAREYVSGTQFNPLITYLVDSHEIFARVPLNDFERIMELIHRLPNNPATQTILIALEARRNPTEAVKILGALPDKTYHQKFGKNLMLAECLVSNPPLALKYLQEAIDIAMQHGYFRAFVNMTSELKNLVLDLAQKNPTVYMENLAKAIRHQSQTVQGTPEGMENPLTKRELDILRRLATGLPISQIAASLHISNNTIKTHLKNIYRKMAVDSRDEAVKLGKELLLV